MKKTKKWILFSLSALAIMPAAFAIACQSSNASQIIEIIDPGNSPKDHGKQNPQPNDPNASFEVQVNAGIEANAELKRVRQNESAENFVKKINDKKLSLVGEDGVEGYLEKELLANAHAKNWKLSIEQAKVGEDGKSVVLDLKVQDQDKQESATKSVTIKGFPTLKIETPTDDPSLPNLDGAGQIIGGILDGAKDAIQNFVPKVKSSIKAFDTRISDYRQNNRNAGSAQPFVNYFSANGKQVINEQYQVLNDYSFRLSFTRKNSKLGVNGTGWILDFLKKDDNSYPLTWFIGTNLHNLSLSDFKFNKSGDEVFKLSYNEEVKDEQAQNNGQDQKVKAKSEVFSFEKNDLPELFFTATNFMGDKISIHKQSGNKFIKSTDFDFANVKYYMRDFAILKVTFANEEQAKKATRNFATKYQNPKIKFKKNILEKTGDELNSKKDYYLLGFPGSGFESGTTAPTLNKRLGNLDKNTGQELKKFIGKWAVKNNFGQDIPGIFDSTLLNDDEKTGIFTFKKGEPGVDDNGTFFGQKGHFPLDVWFNGRYYARWGYSVLVDDSNFATGGSGSLLIDRDFNAVGIFWGQEGGLTNSGLADPFSSLEYKNDQNNTVFEKYDLIYGSDNAKQTKSYKKALDEYLAKNSNAGKSWLFESEKTQE